MPLSRKIYSFPELAYKTFFGLPGALADSLPDKYGTKVFERYLTTQGRDTNSLTPVERLCYMGKRGMGALEYIPEMDIGIHKKAEIDIDELVKLASDILTDRKKIHVSTMEQMMNIGTSAGGARAKAVIAWNPKTGDIRSGQVDAGNGQALAGEIGGQRPGAAAEIQHGAGRVPAPAAEAQDRLPQRKGIAVQPGGDVDVRQTAVNIHDGGVRLSHRWR